MGNSKSKKKAKSKKENDAANTPPLNAILMMGNNGVGRATIFKALQILHKDNPTWEDNNSLPLDTDWMHMRQICVNGILNLLKQSEALYSLDELKYKDCYLDLDEHKDLTEHIELIVSYRNHQFDQNEDLQKLALSMDKIWRLEQI